MLHEDRRSRSPGLVVIALIAVTVGVLAIDRVSEVLLLLAALGLLATGYAARRYARDTLLYRDRDNP